MPILICGSLAYDHIMVFKNRFKHHILLDKVDRLSVAFLVPELRKEFGGCAGNIAYNLKLLGGDPLPMATVGRDFEPYRVWIDAQGIPQRHITTIDSEFTAQAFIITDQDGNQITAFHPGAMNHAHRNVIAEVGKIDIGIVAPDGREGMIVHAEQMQAAGIPFIFDPGQGLPMYDREELLHFVNQAMCLTVNDYEWSLMQERTEFGVHEMAQRAGVLIITRGAAGSRIEVGANKSYDIPAVPISTMIDPTGCGDAYRAGLLYGLSQSLDWETTGRIASLMGAIKAESAGTQNHHFEWAEFNERFKQTFGYALD